ncbi:MAG: aminotransferase class I/II-fold pyridoxal phosphate-dependent enzyme [Elusimicrobia bacterium]|nr:aminotransferase class I/II-fold pyridoxal phosphate-dependent enzyme [Elusimicrobiota bacterium]
MSPLPECSASLSRLPPYLFVKLNAVKEEAVRRGRRLIDLGMGNPDRPTPVHVVDALCRAIREDPSTHRYPTTRGSPALRRAIADWYARRFDVRLDPETEVLPLLGSKEGLAHLFFAYLERSDYAVIPSPCYPVHYNGALLAGARLHLLPLTEANGFLPDLAAVPGAVARKAKVLVLNYPNNPTGAVLPDLSLFREAIAFARKAGGFVVHDNAYSELAFDGYRAPSFLQAPGAKRFGVEFHSFSKSYSMAGWRVAFAAGSAELLSSLAKFKSFVDYGVPGFIQAAAAAALTGSQDYVLQISEIYRQRRDALVAALAEAGWPARAPRATMYLWARLPEPFRRAGSFAFCESLLLREGVVLAPGVGFGPHGEGYVRFAFVEDERRIQEAVGRIGRFLKAARPGRRPAAKAGRSVLLAEHY